MAGIEITAHWSFLVVLALVTVQVGAGVLPEWHPDWSTSLVWTEALLAALLFFASLVAHELAHAIAARRIGIPVRRITLFLFGGVAHLEREPSTPGAELLVAVAGPAMSIVLGVGASLLGAIVAGEASSGLAVDPEGAFQRLGPVATLLLWIGPMNLVLALFNLVPGLPLDGGRVLRAMLWWWTGDLRRATRWGAAAGRIVGLSLATLGVLAVLEGRAGSGLWLVLVGWFLHRAARASYDHLLAELALRGVSVRAIADASVDVVAPDLTLEELVDAHLLAGDRRSFPVALGDRLLGLVCLSDLRRVPREAWPRTRVDAVMTPVDLLSTVAPSTSALDAVQMLASLDVDQLPVVDDHGCLAGILRRKDVLGSIARLEPDLARR